MSRSHRRLVAGAPLAALALACHRPAPGLVAPPRAALTPSAQAAADSGRPPWTRADVDFMSGMIRHHAQAVLMAGWAPTHGASPPVRGLCERIVVAQRDEIAFMQRWLRERREPVPEADASHDMMPGMEQGALMPGMLTAAQLTQLDGARGTEFDRRFLASMIVHHQGAITMVERLFGAQGAAQDGSIFRFGSDVNADQTAEIDRMTVMLNSLPSGGRSP